MTRIPCPFVYANGKACIGHVVRIEAYKADLEWGYANGKWGFGFDPGWRSIRDKAITDGFDEERKTW